MNITGTIKDAECLDVEGGFVIYGLCTNHTHDFFKGRVIRTSLVQQITADRHVHTLNSIYKVENWA